jgi:PhnB protein
MKLTIYVNFAGMCAEAFRYYERHLGGKVVFMMKHGESPEPGRLGPDWQDAVLHARIDIGATELMGADIPKAEPMRSAYLSLGVDSDGGRVLMPLEETFFASRFGQVQDRFGMNWMVLHERPAPAS